MTESRPRRREFARWWPPLAILGLTVPAIVVVRIVFEGDRQAANEVSVILGAVGVASLHFWLVAFSPLSATRRLVAGFLFVVVIAGFLLSFRIRGFTGDMTPILEWRFAPSAAVEFPESAAAGRNADETDVPGLADFPQFFGPERTGKLLGPLLLRDWESSPPEEVWRRRVGAGWSGFAVAGRQAITQEQHGEDEAVVCYDVLTGEVLWTHRDKARYETHLGGVGPRATPTITGDRCFAQGATGILNCLDLATGDVVWSTDILADHDALMPEWGVAGSPLVVEDRVVVSAGGASGRSLVAYDTQTGAFVWGAGTDEAHWSSPVRMSLAGRDQVVIFNASEATAHDLETGDVLWSYPWIANHPHVCLPVDCGGDRVFLSSGYGTGCHLVHIATGTSGVLTASALWKSRALKAKFTNVLEKDGFVYGLDDGILACVDLSEGRRMWKQGRYGHGQILLVRDVLLVMSESGEVVLTEPVPEEHRELASFRALDDKTWNPPAIAGRYLLVRNASEAACFRLPILGE